MKLIKLSILLCVVSFATGCPTQPSKNFKGKDTLISNVNEYLLVQQLRYYCAVEEGKTYDGGRLTRRQQQQLAKEIQEGKKIACGSALNNAEAVAQRVRNDSIEDAMAVIDSNYNDFISTLDQRRSKTDFVLDVIDLGASAATGITKGERPNQILGIAITAFRGGRRSVELNFYKQQTTPILIAKMDDNRSLAYAAMLTKKSKPTAQYSMKEAIRDIVNYYNAGTLIRAFAELAKDTSAKAQESEMLVKELKGENITISNIPTIKHEAISDEVFAISVRLARELETATTAANAIAIPAAVDPPTEANTQARTQAMAARAAKLKDIRLKYEMIWKAIESQEKFTAVIGDMKNDPDFSDLFARLAADRSTVTAEEFDLLLAGFTARVARISKETKNPELFEELLNILRRGERSSG